MDDNIILDSSDQAARLVQGISGWVDRHGRFFGKDEKAARRSGSTHNTCTGCGQTKPKSYMFCLDCKAMRATERYNNRPTDEWDGETPLYSAAADRYFFCVEDLTDFIEEYDTAASELELVVCERHKFREVSEDDFADDLDEDTELPAALTDAISVLNGVIWELTPNIWTPGKCAAVIAPDFISRGESE